jgi:hypothetical protein
VEDGGGDGAGGGEGGDAWLCDWTNSNRREL